VSIQDFYEQFISFFDAAQDFQTKSQDFSQSPTALVKTKFNILFKKIGDTGELRKSVLEQGNDNVIENWNEYQSDKSPSISHIKKMIRIGLSTSGLEYDLEFQNFIFRQESQKKIFEWLYSYLMRFQILNTDFDFRRTRFWLDISLDWINKMNHSGNPSLTQRKKLLEEFESKFIYRQESFIEEKVSTIMKNLSVDLILEQALLNALRREFDINCYSSDYIYQRCLGLLFDTRREEYLTNRKNEKLLTQLLEDFCIFNSNSSYERFIRIFRDLILNINENEKNQIKKFTKGQLGDPRIEKNNWITLQSMDKKVFKTILLWFNEADFNLFFDFVFSGKPDQHARKKCWKRYIAYADDIRIFLPSKTKINEFNQVAIRSNIETVLEPIENLSRLTSFIIKIDKIIIFETVEAPNASYVYDLNSEELRNSSNYDSKQVIKLYDILFNSPSQVKSVNVKNHLAFVDLAPNGLLEYSFYSHRNWRFTHDKNLVWHDAVKTMMHQVHKLAPKETKYDK
jgi:hypothetical protein